MKKPNPIEYTDIEEFNADMMRFISERIAWRLSDSDMIPSSRSMIRILASDLLGLFWRDSVNFYAEELQESEGEA